MKKKEWIKRILLFVLGLFLISFGISLTKHAALGISPISSVANVISIRFPIFSFGTWLAISNCAMLLAQIVILKKDFPLKDLLQIPVSFLSGYFSDLGLILAAYLPCNHLWAKLILVVAGSAVLGFGITLCVIAAVILNPGEALVKAISVVTKKEFGSTKIAFDICWVSFSILLSLLLFRGKVLGTGVGTILSAILVGGVVKLLQPLLKDPITKLLTQ